MWYFGEKGPRQATATTHGGLLRVPSNFHQAKNHKNEDYSIFGRGKLEITSPLGILVLLRSLQTTCRPP